MHISITKGLYYQYMQKKPQNDIFDPNQFLWPVSLYVKSRLIPHFVQMCHSCAFRHKALSLRTFATPSPNAMWNATFMYIALMFTKTYQVFQM